MMRAAMASKCKKHPYEQGVGVCASCLRDRLLDLLAAQPGRPPPHCYGADPQQLQRQQSSSGAPQQLPPPLMFPRSVSPYVSRRRSVDLDFSGDGDRDPRFFSTPQVGRGAGRWKAARGGFLASLFGGGTGQQHHSRSEEVEPKFVDSGAPHRSTSWFSALLPGRRKQQQQKKKSSRLFEEAAEEEDRAEWRARRRGHDYGGGEDDSASESGYTTESSSGWRIAAPTPMRRHASSTHRSMSGFVVCLSPLVRASPRRSQGGEGGGAAAVSGELCGPRTSTLPRRHHQHGGGPSGLGTNRSRKLADLGRFR